MRQARVPERLGRSIDRRRGDATPHVVPAFVASGGIPAMSVLILVVDDEPDVASLFQQQFRRELRSGRFLMRFAGSASEALDRITVPDDANLILVFSDINMPGMSGLELLPRIK